MPEPTPLQTLFDTLPQSGRVEWIGIRPARGEAMKALNSVVIAPGTGLEGDRFKGSETSKRQVTLIQKQTTLGQGGYNAMRRQSTQVDIL